MTQSYDQSQTSKCSVIHKLQHHKQHSMTTLLGIMRPSRNEYSAKLVDKYSTYFHWSIKCLHAPLAHVGDCDLLGHPPAGNENPYTALYKTKSSLAFNV